MKLKNPHTTRFCLLLGLLLTQAAPQCADSESRQSTFNVTFVAQDDEQPLSQVFVYLGEKLLGGTDAQGELKTALTGREGEVMHIRVHCPVGYRELSEPIPLILRRVQGIAQGQHSGIVTQLNCKPKKRSIVVIAKTNGYADLPIFIDGREVARTNRLGVVHVALKMEPDVTFQVKMGTSVYEAELIPREPTQTFTVPDHDQFFVFAQDFEQEKAVRTARPGKRPPKPKPPKKKPIKNPVKVPVRIESRDRV